jgi:hypothetical protein
VLTTFHHHLLNQIYSHPLIPYGIVRPELFTPKEDLNPQTRHDTQFSTESNHSSSHRSTSADSPACVAAAERRIPARLVRSGLSRWCWFSPSRAVAASPPPRSVPMSFGVRRGRRCVSSYSYDQGTVLIPIAA